MNQNGRINRLEQYIGSDGLPLRIDDMAPLLTAINELKNARDQVEYDRLAAAFTASFGIEYQELMRQVQTHKDETL